MKDVLDARSRTPTPKKSEMNYKSLNTETDYKNIIIFFVVFRNSNVTVTMNK